MSKEKQNSIDKVLNDIRNFGARYFIDKDITKDFGKIFRC